MEEENLVEPMHPYTNGVKNASLPLKPDRAKGIQHHRMDVKAVVFLARVS